MYICICRREKHRTNLSNVGRIQEVENTTSCHNCGTINLNFNQKCTVTPTHTRYNKEICYTIPKSPDTNSALLKIARWDLHFSHTVYIHI